MGRVMVSGGKPDMAAPVSGILLSSIAEGSIVKLNEGGNPVEFYVAKHDYESALNGAGRTLLVRKDCYDKRAWHHDSINAYASSDIDAWLNSTYKNLFDADVRIAIGTTKFYYTPGNGNVNVATLARSVFLLSAAEVTPPEEGVSDGGGSINIEGSSLPTASLIGQSLLNGDRTKKWLRTPAINSTTLVVSCTEYGGWGSYSSTGNLYASLPCFTLPSNAMFGKTTMLFKGVA